MLMTPSTTTVPSSRTARTRTGTSPACPTSQSAVSVSATQSRSVVDLATLDDPGSNVLLSSLNSGQGIGFGAFRITDSNGGSDVVVINSTAGTFTTVADVIAAINATDIAVEARVDDSGSGILLYDTGGGTSTLKVEELADGTTAADLGLTKPVWPVYRMRPDEMPAMVRPFLGGLFLFAGLPPV